jgi:thiamine biosynthesis lipoprotein
MNYFARSFIVILSIAIASFGCSPEGGPYVSIAGFTQGTTYHMTYQSPKPDTLMLQDDINSLLAEFDMSLSTYIENSNISRLNRNEITSTDRYFDEVFNESMRIYTITDGAFDITVGPLIDAWGFGPGRKLEMSQDVIDSLMQFVGMDKVSLEDGHLLKQFPETRIDLNAIAQGYSVDIVCDFLEKQKITNYMVEIGGELRTSGLSPRSDAWRVGIDKPFYGNQEPGQELQEVVRLSGKALASSGNYRKYYEAEGKKIVHTIDPGTGYTRMSNLLSVTIITDKCITADGLATSCMVLGLEKAKEFILSQENVDALFIYSDEQGLYLEWMTEGMKEML